jgi:hypothetical protein
MVILNLFQGLSGQLAILLYSFACEMPKQVRHDKNNPSLRGTKQ